LTRYKEKWLTRLIASVPF